jgi:hypothetical protein
LNFAVQGPAVLQNDHQVVLMKVLDIAQVHRSPNLLQSFEHHLGDNQAKWSPVDGVSMYPWQWLWALFHIVRPQNPVLITSNLAQFVILVIFAVVAANAAISAKYWWCKSATTCRADLLKPSMHIEFVRRRCSSMCNGAQYIRANRRWA